MTSYEQFRAGEALKREIRAAMTQPLDVAVLAVATTLRQPHLDHVPAAIVRSGYLSRMRTSAEALPAQIHEAHATERGS